MVTVARVQSDDKEANRLHLGELVIISAGDNAIGVHDITRFCRAIIKRLLSAIF